VKRRAMSLRFRINAVITLLIVIFSMATANLLLEETRRSIREEIEAGTYVTRQLMETVIVNARWGNNSSYTEALLEFLQQVGRVRAHELRLYDEHELLLYISPPSVYKAGRYAPAWFSELVSPKVQEIRLNVPGGAVVIAPDPSRSILDAWDDIKDFTALLVGFLVLINVIVFWLLGRSLRPIGTVLQGLSEMEQGRLNTRLPDFRLPEFASISHTFNRMADTMEQSIAENQRLALIVKQSSDAIMIHDLEGRISFWNPAAERLFGYQAQEVVGASAALIAPPDRRNEIHGNLEAVRQREFIENLETQRLTKDGRVVDVALSAAPLVDPSSGEVIGEICSMRDITEHKLMQAAERELEQNRRLTRIIQSRLEEERRSIARELHDELGQCVTAIKTIGTAIANRTEEKSADTRDNARTIVTVASHIYDVVHSIIRQLRPSALDHLGLTDTLRDTVSNWRSRHPEIACELSLSGEIEGLGEAINITVYRIVQECLTNVIRHSEANRVDIEIGREQVEDLGDAVIVRVKDNGNGLPQRDESEATSFGLMGMRERVQALGGELEISGAPGRGVTIRVVIPASGKSLPDETHNQDT
jgi:two-component system, NarL family, sensor histidine kinase UhpB